MKSITLMIVAGIAVLSSASAALLQADRLLGSVSPGTPSGASNEVGYINFLLTQTSNGTGLVNGFNNSGVFSNATNIITTGGQTYTLISGALVQQGGIVLSLVSKDEFNPSNAFTLGATPGAWLLAKYGNGQTDVFFIGDLAGQSIQVPNQSLTGNGGGLSHTSLYETTATRRRINRVPDGGTSLILLGIALSGLGIVRRASAKA